MVDVESREGFPVPNVLLSCAVTEKLTPCVELLSRGDYETLVSNNESFFSGAMINRSSDSVLVSDVVDGGFTVKDSNLDVAFMTSKFLILLTLPLRRQSQEIV